MDHGEEMETEIDPTQLLEVGTFQDDNDEENFRQNEVPIVNNVNVILVLETIAFGTKVFYGNI